jgi:hypothetical protein
MALLPVYRSRIMGGKTMKPPVDLADPADPANPANIDALLVFLKHAADAWHVHGSGWCFHFGSQCVRVDVGLADRCGGDRCKHPVMTVVA